MIDICVDCVTLHKLRIDYRDAGPFWSARMKLLYNFWSCIYYSVLYIIR